ncbi:hypothetical protein MZ909_09895 [Thermosynechococcus sp. B0]|uniref:hypothetical protein n=1 Tax=unclassified Thermosynechococcus TaxID=2622553 RepID=UPI002576CB42|nr:MULTISPECIES: hypothetical protein [unclassified Thermosynechococcus]WJI23523.1 hypothetical protein MZ909_09895 [Thermosynechococcus sp. B0]WKT83149.1 hypothetical protein QYC28_10010 [Thermosynechococcus sp. HY596]WNC60907.1 hypothetical protein RHJ80_02850 [Thermosynechococcus sp. QS41]WNC62278.1 hypothetical protein RHK13_10005 [Thermosynechococcus sp. HY591]WNC64833.1 hypothetical protein RHK28_10040 [Thermosynechococcus sp. HY593]
MNGKTSLLTLILEGRFVRSGRIAVSQLSELLSSLQKVFYRTGQVLLGETDSIRKGPKSKQLKQLLELDLIEINHGSPSTLLRFDRRAEPSLFPEEDFLLHILETALTGIREVQEPADVLPRGFDRGVLLAWRDVGRLFQKEVYSITFELNHRPSPLRVQYTPQAFQVIQQRIQGPKTHLTTIEGRLLMADFKEEGMRLRVHPPVGDPVVCVFDEEQKEEVLENLLRRVRIIGEALSDPETGKINRVRIHDIEPLEELTEAIEEIPLAPAEVYDFWTSRTLEELAQMQGVQPVANLATLYGTWPGERNDGFEEFIQELRQGNVIGRHGS